MNVKNSEIEMLCSLTAEMSSYGYRYAAYPMNIHTDSDSIQFFRTYEGAADHCLVGQNDADYFKSVPIDSLLSDLKIVIQSGIDLYSEQTIDLTKSAQQLRNTTLSNNNLNTDTVNQKNFEYLRDQLKYTGFGETFDAELKQNMINGEKDFKIMHTGIINNGVPNNDTLKVELNFKKSEQTDMYFFNSYNINLQKEENKPGLEQTFYINKDSASITMKEAYNLMEGRAVSKELKTKEGEAYSAWIKIDFKNTDNSGNFKLNQFHQNYGYDLEASLAKHSIKELNTPQYKEDLLNSLKKGNLQSVTFVAGGAESKMFVEANPQFKSINVYDSSLQRISLRENREEKQGESQQKSQSKDLAKAQDSDSESSQNQKSGNTQKRKAGRSV